MFQGLEHSLEHFGTLSGTLWDHPGASRLQPLIFVDLSRTCNNLAMGLSWARRGLAAALRSTAGAVHVPILPDAEANGSKGAGSKSVPEVFRGCARGVHDCHGRHDCHDCHGCHGCHHCHGRRGCHCRHYHHRHYHYHHYHQKCARGVPKVCQRCAGTPPKSTSGTPHYIAFHE